MNLKIFILGLLAMFLSACSDDSKIFDNSINSEKDNIEIIQDRANKNSSSERILISSITLDCQNNCDGSNNRCALFVDFKKPDIYECHCEGCRMVITNNIGNVDTKNVKIDNSIAQSFAKYIIDKWNPVSNSIKVEKIFVDNYSDVQTVLYEYYLENSNELKTVMFVQNEDERGIMNTIIIDCSGGCDNANETCRERYIVSTGNTECTCQGSCKMTVKKLTPHGD